eukprot:5539265-Pyramimonas_sp.AAC.1
MICGAIAQVLRDASMLVKAGIEMTEVGVGVEPQEASAPEGKSPKEPSESPSEPQRVGAPRSRK